MVNLLIKQQGLNNLNRLYAFVRGVLYITIIFIAIACSDPYEDEIKISTMKYLDAEVDKDWQIMYSLRTHKFQNAVDFNYYVRTMEQDYSNFELVEYDIEDIRFKNGEAFVYVNLEYNQLNNINPLRIKSTLVWENSEFEWGCVRASSIQISSLHGSRNI